MSLIDVTQPAVISGEESRLFFGNCGFRDYITPPTPSSSPRQVGEEEEEDRDGDDMEIDEENEENSRVRRKGKEEEEDEEEEEESKTAPRGEKMEDDSRDRGGPFYCYLISTRTSKQIIDTSIEISNCWPEDFQRKCNQQKVKRVRKKTNEFSEQAPQEPEEKRLELCVGPFPTHQKAVEFQLAWRVNRGVPSRTEGGILFAYQWQRDRLSPGEKMQVIYPPYCPLFKKGEN